MTEYLYRVGKPRITETTNRFDTGRGTGGMGTGVYAYRDLWGMEEHLSRQPKTEQPIYRIKNICKNPLELRLNFDRERLHDAAIAMRRAGIAKGEGKKKAESKAFDILARIPGIMRDDSYEEKKKLISRINSAIRKERKCSETKRGKETYGSRHCSHAMNHLLIDSGYDCVLPTDGAGGNRNDWGCVLLKETVEKEVDHKLSGYEDIDDFGEIIDA